MILARGVAGLNAGDLGDEGLEPGVHRLDNGLRLRAAADVGLIGRDDEDITGGGQSSAACGSIGKEAELIDGLRRVGFAGSDDLDVERAVAVEKDSGTEGGGISHEVAEN